MIVKAGDAYPIEWKANTDLTDADVRLVAKKRTGAVVELDCEVTDGPEGIVQHVLTGDLPTGFYRVELEATIGGETVTFPSSGYAQLVVQEDLR